MKHKRIKLENGIMVYAPKSKKVLDFLYKTSYNLKTRQRERKIDRLVADAEPIDLDPPKPVKINIEKNISTIRLPRFTEQNS